VSAYLLQHRIVLSDVGVDFLRARLNPHQLIPKRHRIIQAGQLCTVHGPRFLDLLVHATRVAFLFLQRSQPIDEPPATLNSIVLFHNCDPPSQITVRHSPLLTPTVALPLSIASVRLNVPTTATDCLRVVSELPFSGSLRFARRCAVLYCVKSTAQRRARWYETPSYRTQHSIVVLRCAASSPAQPDLYHQPPSHPPDIFSTTLI